MVFIKVHIEREWKLIFHLAWCFEKERVPGVCWKRNVRKTKLTFPELLTHRRKRVRVFEFWALCGFA